jgi:hypothetical protein
LQRRRQHGGGGGWRSGEKLRLLRLLGMLLLWQRRWLRLWRHWQLRLLWRLQLLTCHEAFDLLLLHP